MLRLSRRALFNIKKHKDTNYSTSEIEWQNYEPNPIPLGSAQETRLHRHLYHTRDDDQRLIELEKWRVSQRHLASIMGEENPAEFDHEKQVEAIRYLMPGYTLFAESNPQMEHPYEWMGEYAPKGRQRQMKRKKLTHDGRPLSQFYYEDEVQANTIVARVSTMNFLSREAASAARNKGLTGMTSVEAGRCLTDTNHASFAHFNWLTRYCTRDEWKVMIQGFNTQHWNLDDVKKAYGKYEKWKIRIIHQRKREDVYVRKTKPWSKKINHDVHKLAKMELEERYYKCEGMMSYEIKRAKTCWTPELMKKLRGQIQHKTGTRVRWNALHDTYMTYRVPQIEVFGELFKNKIVSTATNIHSGSTTVNATVIRDGAGRFEVNGLPLTTFFQHNNRHVLKALAPFSVIQSMQAFDAVITVTGFGGGDQAFRAPGGSESRQPTYGRSNNYATPDAGAFPFFGPGSNHHRAIGNGGAQAAKVVAAALTEALIPLLPENRRADLLKSQLMMSDVRKKERTWTAGAGLLKESGRRPKTWRRR